MFVCHSPYISYFFSENAPKDNIFAKFAAVAWWSGRITISAETVEVSSKKKKTKDREKPHADFVAEKTEIGMVVRGSNFLVADTTFAPAEAYQHL